MRVRARQGDDATSTARNKTCGEGAGGRASHTFWATMMAISKVGCHVLASIWAPAPRRNRSM